MHPYPDIHNPIDAGLRPSPPNSIGVDQISGISAVAALSSITIVAKLAIEITTGFVTTQRRGGGFSLPFLDGNVSKVELELPC
jgi:hypothetical protein